MTRTPAAGRGSPLLAALTGVVILADGALVGIGVLVLQGYRNGNLTTSEAATFLLMGASAALGAVVMLLAAIAFTRGPRGCGMARLASGLAWLRVLVVLIALAVVAVRLGVSAVAGSFETFGAVIALADASFAVIVTGAAVRRTGSG
jgi:hypothetical protein